MKVSSFFLSSDEIQRASWNSLIDLVSAETGAAERHAVDRRVLPQHFIEIRRGDRSTQTAATQGEYCGRSSRSAAMTDAVPIKVSSRCATSANGIGDGFIFSRRRPAM